MCRTTAPDERTNIITGTAYEPGKWYTERYDYHTLPVLARPGTDPLHA